MEGDDPKIDRETLPLSTGSSRKGTWGRAGGEGRSQEQQGCTQPSPDCQRQGNGTSRTDKSALGASSCWLSGNYLLMYACCQHRGDRNWWDTESQSAGKLRPWIGGQGTGLPAATQRNIATDCHWQGDAESKTLASSPSIALTSSSCPAGPSGLAHATPPRAPPTRGPPTILRCCFLNYVAH